MFFCFLVEGSISCFFFFFQAEDGIRDRNVTGVQTCALPICFAYRPGSDEKTVIRGGYGRFYDSAEGREIDGAADIYPYVSRGIYSQSVSQTTPYKTTDQ